MTEIGDMQTLWEHDVVVAGSQTRTPLDNKVQDLLREVSLNLAIPCRLHDKSHKTIYESPQYSDIYSGVDAKLVVGSICSHTFNKSTLI